MSDQRSRVLVALAIGALVLGACSSGSDDTATEETPSTEQTTAAAEDPTSDAAVTETETASSDEGSGLDADATLVFADPFQNDTIDPDKNESGFPLRQLYPVYDRLIHVTPGGELTEGLATDWEFVDETTFRMTLRDDVVFHDGETFNADAVVANLDRSRSLEAASSAVQGAVEAIEEVIAVDETTVEFRLTEAALNLPFDLAANIGMMISPAVLDQDLDLTAVGTGGWELASFDPGVSATYTASDDYWDPDAVAVNNFEIRSIADAATRLNAVQSGQVDLTFIDENQVADATAADVEVIEGDSVSVWNIFLNQTRGPLGEPGVRRAMMHAVNRDTIVENLAFGFGDPTIQLFPPGYFAYNDEWGPDRYEYDPEGAVALLEEAGFPDGVDLSFLVLNRPLDVQMAEALQQMFADANIRVELQVEEPARFSIFTDGDVDIFMGRWGGRADPLDTLTANAGSDGFINPGGGTTDAFDALLGEIRSTAQGDERSALLREANAEFADQALDVPIFARTVLFASNGCVVGFQPYVVGADEYRGVGIESGCK